MRFGEPSRTAITMKGTGGGYGFDAISAMGGDLEEAGKSSDGPGAQQLIRALDDYLNNVKVVYGS